MCDGGGSDVEWGNGQPGNQAYDPNYGTAAQAPTIPLQSSPEGSVAAGVGGFNPETSGGNQFVNQAFPTGGGTGNGGSGAPAPTQSGALGFDESGFQGIDFSALNLNGVQSSNPLESAPGGSSLPGTSGFDESGFATSAGPAVGQSAVSGLPGVGESPDPTAKAASAGGKSGGSSSDNGVLSSLGIKNPLGVALAAGGLGYSMMQGQKDLPTTKTLQAQAASLNENGKQLMSYLQQGNLPPGLKANLDQATAAAKAKVIQNFASQGMSADPTKNSALAQQLAQIDQAAMISIAQVGQQLMSSGLQSSGMASDLYKTLSQIDQTKTAAIGKSIANMAAAFNGGGGTTIQLGGK